MSSLIVSICKINDIKPIDGADKIELAYILGWQTIVSKGQYKVGDLVIFCPIDCIIPANLIEKYNLEFLKKNGRLQTIKLRGQISQGLILGLDCLPKGNWKEGKEVSAILGITKYEVPELNAGTQHKKEKIKDYWLKYQAKEITLSRFLRKSFSIVKENLTPKSRKKMNPLFDKYTDIENIKNFNNVFEAGEEVIITEKIHGCLEASTQILLEDGTTKEISEIVNKKLKCNIIGINECGNIVSSKITNWFNNGKTDNWIRISYKRRGFGTKGNYYGSLTCTENHQIYINGSYVEAKNLKIGNKVSLIHEFNKLSYLQESVLTGMMLGDGYFEKMNSSASITFGHCKKHEEYLNFKLSLLSQLAGKKQIERISGFGTKMVRGRTIRHPSIYLLFNNWIVNNRKTVPINIKLSPITLAVWYMDDGSLAYHKSQENRANFAVCGFNENSVDNLVSALKIQHDIVAIKFKSGKYWRIRLNSSEAEKLFILIAPYVPEIMQYKLPMRFRHKNIILNDKQVTEYYKFMEEKEIINIEHIVITSKNKSNYKKYKYDIETETHNFIANGILVHNSNFRAGNLLRKHNCLLDKLLFWKGEYEFVYGSHNMQKVWFVGGGYYKENIWLKIVHKYNLDKIIPQDYIVYGEVYGPRIQKNYDYGLTEIDCLFFDVKYKNKYLSFEEKSKFLQSLNLPIVPVLFMGKYNDETLKLLTTGSSTICEKQVKEGCVVTSLIETTSRIGRKILKSINADYLLLKDNTDFH